VIFSRPTSILVSILSAILLAVPSTATAEDFRTVDEILFSGDPRPTSATVSIWNGEIPWKSSDTTPAIMDDIRAATAEINAVLAGSRVKFVEAAGKPAALQFTFVPPAQLAGKPGSAMPFRPGRIGHTFTFKKQDGSIRGAGIFIANKLPRATRQYIIRHELMHALGIPKHVTYVFDSLLRTNWRMSAAPRELLDFDRKIIRFVYHHLKPGFTKEQTRRMYDANWGKPAS
jgi:hypothetical protein